VPPSRGFYPTDHEAAGLQTWRRGWSPALRLNRYDVGRGFSRATRSSARSGSASARASAPPATLPRPPSAIPTCRWSGRRSSPSVNFPRTRGAPSHRRGTDQPQPGHAETGDVLARTVAGSAGAGLLRGRPAGSL